MVKKCGKMHLIFSFRNLNAYMPSKALRNQQATWIVQGSMIKGLKGESEHSTQRVAYEKVRGNLIRTYQMQKNGF